MNDLSDRVRQDYGMRFRHKEEANGLADEIESLQTRIEELESPVLPDEVAKLTTWLDDYTKDDPIHSAINTHYKLREILGLIERLARENEKRKQTALDAIKQISKLQARNKELEAALETIAAASHIGDGTTAINDGEKFYSCQAYARAALEN